MRENILRIKENMKKVIIGKDEVMDRILTALLSGGHVLLEDLPGTGKTVLAKSLAEIHERRVPPGAVYSGPAPFGCDRTSLF